MIPLCPVMSWLFIRSPGKFMILLIAKDNCAGQPLIGKYDIFFVSVSAFNVCWNKDCCFYLYYKFLFLEQESK